MLYVSYLKSLLNRWMRAILPAHLFKPTPEELLKSNYPEYYTNKPYSLEKDPTYNEVVSKDPTAHKMMGKWILNYSCEGSSFYSSASDFCSDCPECISRDGKVKSYKEWEKIGLPMSNLLPCMHSCSCRVDWSATIPEEICEELNRKIYSKGDSRPARSEEDRKKAVQFYIDARDHIS